MSLVGSLEDLGLGDILQIVSLSRKSGVLNLSWPEAKGKIIFRDGQVVCAVSTDEQRSIASFLANDGVLSPTRTAEVEQMTTPLPDAESVKEKLEQHYNIPRDKIESVIQRAIESTVFMFFSWPEGTFSFDLQDVDGELSALQPPDHALVLETGISPQYLAMEGTRLQDERRRGGEAPVGPPRGAAEQAASPEQPGVAHAALQPAEESLQQSESAAPDSETDFGSVAEALEFYEGKRDRPGQAPEEAPGPERTAEAPETGAREEAPPRPEPAATGPKVVVVDDDKLTLDSVCHHIIKQGYNVDAFTDAGAALAALQGMADSGDHPLAVVADLIMPDSKGDSTLGGLEVLERSRNMLAGLSVYVVSDYENQQARKKAEELGARFFFMKPKQSQLDPDFGSPELVNFVQVLISGLESEGKAPPSAKPEAEGLINLGEELRKEFGEEVVPPSEEEEVVPSRGLHMLRAMINELNDPGSNGQITLMILRFAAELMNRAVIFLVAKKQLAGLGQFGIQIDGADPQKHVRQIRIPLDAPSIFREAVQKRLPVKKSLKMNQWNEYLVRHLGGEVPREVFVAPIIAGGKIPAILYGDNVPEDKEIGDTESLEIFLSQAGLAMEKALLERRLRESGKPSEEE